MNWASLNKCNLIFFAIHFLGNLFTALRITPVLANYTNNHSTSLSLAHLSLWSWDFNCFSGSFLNPPGAHVLCTQKALGEGQPSYNPTGENISLQGWMWGICGTALKWLASFFKVREQRVELGERMLSRYLFIIYLLFRLLARSFPEGLRAGNNKQCPVSNTN